MSIRPGDIRLITFPFFNKEKRELGFKQRPGLVLGNTQNNDFIVLPISRVSNKKYLDANYDVFLDSKKLRHLNLTSDSYVRTNKQTPIFISQIDVKICNIKKEYPELYDTVLRMAEQFNGRLFSCARGKASSASYEEDKNVVLYNR